MSVDAYITIGVIVISFILFATEVFSIDYVALGIIVVLTTTGVLTPEEGLKGFANEATLTVAAMFVISDALLKTGIIKSIAPLLIRLIRWNYQLALATIMTGVGGLSAFINNTPVVATLIPIITDATRKTKTAPSRYLIPLSYGAIFGGCCTLIGTSTNLLVNGIAIKSGMEPLKMFTLAPLGLVFFACGTLYLLLVSWRLLPKRPVDLDISEVNVKDYLTELKILKPDSKKPATLSTIFRKDGMEVTVEQVKRGDKIIRYPAKEFELAENDHLLVRGEREKIKNLLENESLIISDQLGTRDFADDESKLVEIVILPNSPLVNKRLANTDFLHRYRAKVLAIRQRGTERLDDLTRVRLTAGDMLMLQTTELGHKMLISAQSGNNSPFVSLSTYELSNFEKKKLFFVLAILVTVVSLASFEVLPIVIAALAGVAVLGFSRIISMEEAYRAIDWQVIVLLAGALCLGEAMSKSGVSEMIASFMVDNVGQHWGPVALISALYITTSLCSELMSNNAAAALLTPIAISIAVAFDSNLLPFVLAIAFAASASFMTPIGYQTNTMVYSAGNYRFVDFVKVGGPLNLIFWLVATLLIPVFYPL